MLMRVMGAAVVLVIVGASSSEAPTSTVPKSSVEGFRVRGAAEDVPTKVMKSREVAASEEISRVPERVIEVAAGVGAKAMEKVQVLPGGMVAQVVVAVKSVEGIVERTWSVVVPVLVSVTTWDGEAFPMVVLGKVREPCESWKVARTEEVAGELERMGTAVPVRPRVVGLEAASDSMVRVPASVRGWVPGVVVGSSLMGA